VKDLIEFGGKTMMQRSTVDCIDTLKLGIVAMTDARWNAFFQSMVAVGVYEPCVSMKP
jgi:hypothetical protein